MRIAGVVSLLLAFLQVSSSQVITDLRDLGYDEDERLTSHHLLYSDNERCAAAFQSLVNAHNFLEVHPMSEEVAQQFFGADTTSPCRAVCVEQGIAYDYVPHVFPHRKAGVIGSNAADWTLKNCANVEIGFISNIDRPLHINWVNGEERVRLQILNKGERNTIWQQTYLGHVFEVFDPTGQTVVRTVEARHNGLFIIGHEKSKLQPRQVVPQIKMTLDAEWDRAHRVVRTFTEFGFNRGRLPDDIYGSMAAYYYNNRLEKHLEEWNDRGLYVNWWEADVFIMPVSWQLKKYWQSRLKTLVEQWVGIPLELTDIYGLREYTDGARLLTHVDREETHAASLIINVAQGKIRKPWTVEIYDFSERLHEVTMDPGDIVYYESARCLHGRMQPLEGEYYVNLFAHYRPVGDPQWFLKKNPASAPAHAVDLGTCTSDGNNVSCDGQHDAPFLSPKLETLKGPTDLFKFWEKVSPKPVGSDEL